MGQQESTTSKQPKIQQQAISNQKSGQTNQVYAKEINDTQALKDSGVKSQQQISESLSNSRLQMKMQRELEMKKVSESKDKDMVLKLLKIMEQNQEQLVEILDERVQLINQNLEEKLLVLENKIDEIQDKLKDFENETYNESKTQNVKEEIGSLRKEVKQMVAISEKYIKDENKLHEIQNLSVLHKTIQKENKPTKKEINPTHSKLQMMREKSKIQKQIQESQILKDFDEITHYTDNNYRQSNIQFFSHNNDYQQTKIE